MAKILDSISITENLQKIAETSAGYVINGHYYNKNTLVPRPLKLISATGHPADISMSRRAMRLPAMSQWGKTAGDSVVIDRDDPTITYMWTTDVRGNNINWIKLKEQNGNVEQLLSKKWGSVPTTQPFAKQYCGQDSTYLYFLMDTTTYGSYFGRIDKATLTWNTSSTFGTSTISLSFKETENHIYVGNKKIYGTAYLNRYSKITNVMEVIPTLGKTGGTYGFTSTYSPPIHVAENDMYFYDLSYNVAAQKLYFTRYKMDTTQSVLSNIQTETAANVTWGTVITQLPIYTTSGSITNKYDLFITIASNGKRYLNVACMENANSTTPANIPFQGIYTFLIDEATRDLTFKSFSTVTGASFRSFIGVRNDTFLVCMSDDSTIFMNFDEATERFAVTDTMSNQPSHIGVDQMENIWVVNSLTEVDMLSPYVPTNVNVAFEKSSYKYEGVDYDSFITVEAKNYTGTNIAVNLEVTLKGNAMFKSNSTKIITDVTTTGGVKVIPITIKGSGTISAYPKLVM